MMFDYLDKLLSDPNYYSYDIFFEAEEVIEKFTSLEWSELLKVWRQKSPEWINNFQDALPNSAEPESASNLAFDMMSENDIVNIQNGLAVLQRLNASNLNSHLNELKMNKLRDYWLEFPELRERIKQITWEAGKSGELRRRLGFERWEEAKQIKSCE